MSKKKKPKFRANTNCRKTSTRQRKTEFYKALKQLEGTERTVKYQIPKQKCSRKVSTIITTVSQEIYLEYLKHNVTSSIELRNTIYAAAVATANLSVPRIDG